MFSRKHTYIIVCFLYKEKQRRISYYRQAFQILPGYTHKTSIICFKLTPVATRIFPDGGRVPEGGLPVNPIPPRETGRAAEGL